MKKNILALFVLFFISSSAFAGDFITEFLNKCVEVQRPVNNVNIGKAMLNKMMDITGDESLKKTFSDLTNIRIITSENKKDSQFYFDKANELVKEQFEDFKEVVSVNERKSKMSILMKDAEKKKQDMILISLDDNSKLTIITLSGKIDLASLSKLSEAFDMSEITSSDSTDKEHH